MYFWDFEKNGQISQKLFSKVFENKVTKRNLYIISRLLYGLFVYVLNKWFEYAFKFNQKSKKHRNDWNDACMVELDETNETKTPMEKVASHSRVLLTVFF